MLFQEPFTHVNDQGLLGVFDEADALKVIGILDRIKGNAGVGRGKAAGNEYLRK